MVAISARVCWVCGSEQTARWKPRSIDRKLLPEDLQITDSRYGVTLELLRCQDCGFIFADAQDVNELVLLYERLEDKAYEEGLENRVLQMRMLLDVARKANPSARTMLEIGSGIGLLVREGEKAGLEATGVEPSRSLVDAGARLLGVKLYQGTFPQPRFEGQEFDLVFVVDVIEHVADPIALLRACTRVMSPKSILIVVTPDLASLAARLLGRRWWHFRLAHVGYFSHSTMRKAARAASLEIVEWRRALWFFPISYIASRLEQYLPVGWLNRLVLSTELGRRFYHRVVGLNPHDSWVFLLRRVQSQV